jgi:hypothetical protein
VFIEALVLPCLRNGSFQNLLTILKNIDSSLELFREHLVAADEYFMKTKQYKLAYIFQDLLQVNFFLQKLEN